MSRPKTKSELLDLSKVNFDKLKDFINKLESKDQNTDFPPGTLNRNIRDVLMHLHHWHLMLKDWYFIGMAGEKPEMPAKGYTWKTTPDLNKWIRQKYRNVSLKDAKKHLEDSYREIREIIDSLSNEELFEKKRYKWTGTTSIGSYFISATSSHYDWAFKLIKRCKK
ncbi:MAG: ClbS/DfsB family four-helix bundle protein [Bacteroidota bacterium]